jgi:hypothetical protein
VNAAIAAAAREGLETLASEIRASAEALGAEHAATAEEIAAAAVRIGAQVLAGKKSAAAASEDLAKLTEAFSSELVTASWSLRARRIEIAGKLLDVLFKVAAAAAAA